MPRICFWSFGSWIRFALEIHHPKLSQEGFQLRSQPLGRASNRTACALPDRALGVCHLTFVVLGKPVSQIIFVIAGLVFFDQRLYHLQ